MLQQARTVQHPFVVFVVAAVCLAGFPGGAVVKNPPTNVGDTGLLPGFGEKEMATHSRIPARGNPKDRGGWQATIHGVAKESDTT